MRFRAACKWLVSFTFASSSFKLEQQSALDIFYFCVVTVKNIEIINKKQCRLIASCNNSSCPVSEFLWRDIRSHGDEYFIVCVHWLFSLARFWTEKKTNNWTLRQNKQNSVIGTYNITSFFFSSIREGKSNTLQ